MDELTRERFWPGRSRSQPLVLDEPEVIAERRQILLEIDEALEEERRERAVRQHELARLAQLRRRGRFVKVVRRSEAA